MPTLSPPATVLVTGANGYIGLSIVHALLQRGYSVRGTVRTPSAAESVRAIIARREPVQASKLEVVVVPDLTAEGAFDEAVKGVTGIIHTASPVIFTEEDPEVLYKPAIGGTIGILQSALKHGQNVRRVVVTSSMAAIVSTDGPDGVYNEDAWNDDAIRIVEEQGRNAPGGIKYIASKTLSERAAWNFMRDHGKEAKFDLSTIIPSWVMGPLPDDPSSPSELRSVMKVLYDQVFAVPPPSPRDPPCFNHVDARDVVDLHIRALEVEAAGGERIIASSHVSSWQDWLNTTKELGVLPKLDKGDPAAATNLPPHPALSNEKAKRIFGIEFKTVRDTFQVVYEEFRSRGWLKHLE